MIWGDLLMGSLHFAPFFEMSGSCTIDILMQTYTLNELHLFKVYICSHHRQQYFEASAMNHRVFQHTTLYRCCFWPLKKTDLMEESQNANRPPEVLSQRQQKVGFLAMWALVRTDLFPVKKKRKYSMFVKKSLLRRKSNAWTNSVLFQITLSVTHPTLLLLSQLESKLFLLQGYTGLLNLSF